MLPPPIRALDHVGLHVADVERSLAFYRGVLGLQPIPRPDLGFPGAWLALGPAQALHLIQRAPGAPFVAGHFALAVGDAGAWRARLAGLDVPHRGPLRRPDGATQLFLADPDGHAIELVQLPAKEGRAGA